MHQPLIVTARELKDLTSGKYYISFFTEKFGLPDSLAFRYLRFWALIFSRDLFSRLFSLMCMLRGVLFFQKQTGILLLIVVRHRNRAQGQRWVTGVNRV